MTTPVESLTCQGYPLPLVLPSNTNLQLLNLQKLCMGEIIHRAHMRPIPSWVLLSTGCVSYFLSSCSVKVQRLAGSSSQVSTRVTFSISLTGFLLDSSLPLPLPRFLSPSHLSVFSHAAFSLGLERKENAFRGQAEVAWWCLACKPSTLEGKAEDQEVFKASLCYTACLRPSWATMRLYLKNNQNK